MKTAPYFVFQNVVKDTKIKLLISLSGRAFSKRRHEKEGRMRKLVRGGKLLPPSSTSVRWELES